jgi:PAS domain S-box-containing protein
MKRSLILLISFIVFLTPPFLHAAEAVKPSGQVTILQEILILNSYHPGYAWSDDEQTGIIDVFQAKDKNWVPVIEYLDLRRLPDGRHLTELKRLFRLKYQNKKFSVVIAMDNPALEFAVGNQAELFGNAPIVFCGINNYTPSLLKGRSEVTGILEAIDIAGTIEVMLRLHPAAREIFSPQDYTTTGLAVHKELEALVPRFGAKVRFHFYDPLTIEELLKELERLPENGLVLAVGFVTDKSGHTFNTSEIAKLYYEHSPVPIYSTYEQQLGFGIVGGKLLSARIHGANAGRIALRVLAGEKASAIPVVLESDSRLMFDYEVMSRFGIPLSALPEGSIVINKTVSFYAAHRVVIQTALGIIGILTIIIYLLTINIIQRRRSVIALRESEDRYRSLFDNSIDAVLLTAPDGRILAANPEACRIFERTEEEICRIGRNGLIDLTDPRLAAALEKRVRTGQFRGELTYVRKNGTLFSGEMSSAIFRDRDGNSKTSMIIRDITERKQAEEKIKASLREKELLIMEIHHRVKNNLQVISGLLDLQARSSGNPELMEMFRESQSRIRSMALVHEKLYGSNDLARIDLAGYVRTLSQDLFQSYKINPGKIDLIIQTDGDVYVDINKAIPCGLILNELISNALKHAFPGDRHGELRIIIHETENTEIEIVVRDNGLSLPDDVDIHQPRTVGLYLVNGLVKNQLDGQMEIRRDNGTEFRIKFPL